MEVVVDAIISVSLEMVFRKLGSSDLLQFARQEHVDTEMKKWKKKLSSIGELLNDAEDKQISKPSVKKWLEDLRDLAYDMEDVLDEFGYEALRRKVMAEGDDKASTSKVRKFIPTCCTTFTPIGFMHSVKMGSKIKEISSRLQEISERDDDDVRGLDKVAAIAAAPALERPITTSLVHESRICGRDSDKRTIIGMLLKDEPVIEGNVCVVSIVAMGGMGKTTLARLVYDDAETANHFDLKAWVCVSDQFDAVRITKTILNSVTSPSNEPLDFNQLQEKLREQLKGKRFLLVLDDFWKDNYSAWDSLRSPFWSGARGSKIIVTTRSQKVAIMMGGGKNLHQLKHLSGEDCLSVFEMHAFENRDITKHPDLASIGKKIVKKCGGLPLAAQALGGLLRYEQNENRWRSILTSKIWDLPADECGILPALRLSYNHLPSHLKRCFAYCAIFPKDYGFDETELARLWMAEGLIEHSEDEKLQMEDLGEGYFQELLCRSFFQPSSNDGFKFVMHDLINDLAKSVAGEICYSLEEDWERNHQQQANLKKVRHSSFVRGKCDVFKKFEAFRKMEHLRTFIALPIEPRYGHSLSNKVLMELMPKLRVLSLNGYGIREIPNSIGDLKHLRYLNLSYTKIRQLPDSIGNLYNLQTLILKSSKLTILPITIKMLINLRHLDVTFTLLEEMPSEIGKLKKLQVLSDFIVGKGNALKIKELKGMTDLRDSLCISNLENVEDIEDVKDIGLDKKHKLKELKIEWSDDSGSGVHQMNVLESLQPNSGLNKLRIESYGGPKFPRWMRDALFTKMVNLTLIGCKKCTSLPCLGRLLLLRELRIEEMDGVKAIGAEFYGGDGFPSLESLWFEDMSEWEQWEDGSSSSKSSFPCLRELNIGKCPKLINKLPTYLPSLATLKIRECPKLESPLGRLPSLSKLDVEGCNEMMLKSGIELTSLAELGISGILELIELHEGYMSFFHGLRVLDILRCQALKYLWENGFGLEKLENLYIFNCDQLERLSNGWQRLACLGELAICDCPKLVSFPDTGFPPMLKSLNIFRCGGLKCLPDGMMLTRDSRCVLEELRICDCSSLICFPKGQLPTTLTKLHIWDCKNLESLPQGIKGCSLEYLKIQKCSSLIGFPEGGLPSTLKELNISDCEKLESLPEGIMQHHSITTPALQVLRIDNCSSLTSFPRGKFPSNLKELKVKDCEKLESISEEMFHYNNPSLESLILWNYPKLKTLPDCLHNLRSLRIVDCENLELLPHQFQNFTSLESLCITGHANIKTLPECLYNLTYLEIVYCENLELLPHQFQNLSCLETLKIENCKNIKIPLSRWGLSRLTSLRKLTIGGIFPQATSFADDHLLSLLPSTLTHLSIMSKNLESLASLSLQTLTSLEMLFIYDCPKLQSFLPREGLPDMLSRLYIINCPLLSERCSKNKGQDWPNIAHIPRVEIDGKSIIEL